MTRPVVSSTLGKCSCFFNLLSFEPSFPRRGTSMTTKESLSCLTHTKERRRQEARQGGAQEGAKLRLFFPRLLCANAHQVQSFYLFRKLIGVDKCVAVEIGGGS